MTNLIPDFSPIVLVGFAAQGFFSARILFQWIKSEKAKTVVSPSIYWICSLIGAYLMFIYGWCRNDFSIILGQLISYYIYIWNLDAKGIWKRLPTIIQIVLFATPIAVFTFVFQDASSFINRFIHNEDIPLGLIIFGSAGQIIFTLRFVYQWFYSFRKKESYLPEGFWIISLIGSGVIVTYGIIRRDPVLILGQSVGFFAYTRNLIIGFRAKTIEESTKNDFLNKKEFREKYSNSND